MTQSLAPLPSTDPQFAPTWVESRHQDLGHVTAIRLASNHHHDTSNSGRSKRVPAPFFAFMAAASKNAIFRVNQNYRPTPPRDLGLTGTRSASPLRAAVQLPSQDELYRSMAIEGDPRNESESFSPLSAALQLTGIIDLTGTSGTSAPARFRTISCWIFDILLHGFRRLFTECTGCYFPPGALHIRHSMSSSPLANVSPYSIMSLVAVFSRAIGHPMKPRNPLEARGDLARHPEGSSATLRTALMARHDFTARPVSLGSHTALLRHTRDSFGALRAFSGSTQRLGVARNVQNLLRAGSEGRRSLGRRLTRGVGSTPRPRTAGRARARVEITNLSNPAGGMKPSLLAVKDIDIAIGADTYNCIILSTMTGPYRTTA
ncbi:hypothetical protein FB451DRAFT_1414193 [Mycena latifolia]|nr:hypothetical protein FB451DRAFT_1414193 [Mycena latifolia]